MAHVYRAVWTDNSLNVFDVLCDEFGGWLRARGTPIPLERGASTTVNGRTVTWAEISNSVGDAMQLHLREPTDDDAGAWITSVTAMRMSSHNVLWVDVHNEAIEMWGGMIYAPRVVRSLLLAGGEPHIGRDSVEVQPKEVDDQNSLDNLIDGLFDESRVLGYLLIRVGQGTDRRLAIQRATYASETLAGLVQVYLIDENSARYLNAILGDELAIGQLGSLLLMPGVMQNPDDARLSYHIAEDDLDDDQKTLGRIVLRRLGSTTQWVQVPHEWSLLRKKVNSVRRSLLERIAGGGLPDTEALDVFGAEEFARLQSEYRDIQDQLISAMVALEEAETTIDYYREKSVEALLMVSGPETVVIRKGSIQATIAEARRLATRVVIPETAEKEIGALDRLEMASVWAKDLGSLIAALDTYARLAANRNFRGNFLMWCEQMGGYPSTKIAMTESESTLKSDSLRHARTFTVSQELDSSGRKLMVAHAKIQTKGGRNIPRVYFWDDSRGQTKKIHIGFIGPHYLVPSSSF